MQAHTAATDKIMDPAGGFDDSHRSGTSIFDPTLCELIYRWFCPPKGKVLDPFAGGSVRGIVAGILALDYVGIELSAGQVEANRTQAKEILRTGVNGWAGKKGFGRVQWIEGDAQKAAAVVPGRYDLIFSCPPYGDLEVYSDDPRDLSTMPHDAFLVVYRAIIAACVKMLKPNRFACFVVGDYRDKQGFYRNFVSDTITAFEDAGMKLYNDAILVTALGSLPIRVGMAFGKYRKLGKTHQNVLVFYNGDVREIPKEFPEIEVEELGIVLPNQMSAANLLDSTAELTPVEQRGAIWIKRDDLFSIAGVSGGKVRTCWALAQGASGLITAGSRHSPQVDIVAHIAQHLGIPCRVHVPSGDATAEIDSAKSCRAEIIIEKPGYNSVIVSRAKKDAQTCGWMLIPFGMECQEAVNQTAPQVANLPQDIKRLIIPVGSGMSLAGVLAGLKAAGRSISVVGIVVGADPKDRLDSFAPGWRERCTLQSSGIPYQQRVENCSLDGLILDPIYEAKCIPFIQPGDLLWIVGIRGSAVIES